jgi:hypothetical protein
LSGDSTHVTVSGDTIELAGNVTTGKEKITATRIVQSYAGSKKVVNHLTVGGGGSRKPSHGAEEGNTPPNSANPASNPDSNKENPPSAAKPPRP